MHTIKQIDEMLQKRINFIEMLLLIGSSSHNKQINTDIFIKKHQETSKQEKQSILNFIRIVRIDQKFRREFHILSLNIFQRLQSSWVRKRIIYGRYAQLVQDYIDYFDKMNENNIREFITQTFQYTLQSQTSAVMILLQTLCKYLRIKTQCIIKRILQKECQIQIKQTPSKVKPRSRRTYSFKKPKTISAEQFQNIFPKQKSTLLVENNSPFEGLYLIKPARIKTTIDIILKNSVKRINDHSKTSKRKIIDSYKQKIVASKQYTITTISRNSTTINKSSYISLSIPNKMYSRSFETIFSEQLSKHIQLLNIQDIEEKQAKTISIIKKNQWLSKTLPKMLAEVCQRNESIRRTLDIWIEKINKK